MTVCAAGAAARTPLRQIDWGRVVERIETFPIGFTQTNAPTSFKKLDIEAQSENALGGAP
jgi:hypothetical protein